MHKRAFQSGVYFERKGKQFVTTYLKQATRLPLIIEKFVRM